MHIMDEADSVDSVDEADLSPALLHRSTLSTPSMCPAAVEMEGR